MVSTLYAAQSVRGGNGFTFDRFLLEKPEVGQIMHALKLALKISRRRGGTRRESCRRESEAVGTNPLRLLQTFNPYKEGTGPHEAAIAEEQGGCEKPTSKAFRTNTRPRVRSGRTCMRTKFWKLPTMPRVIGQRRKPGRLDLSGFRRRAARKDRRYAAAGLVPSASRPRLGCPGVSHNRYSPSSVIHRNISVPSVWRTIIPSVPAGI
jgi:hypothetical protein